MRRHFVLVAVLATGGPVAALGLLAPQDLHVTPRLTFEVVSVKPNQSREPTGRLAVQPGGRFMWTNTTLKSLIGVAYQRRAFDDREVLGGPHWIDSDRFDIIAKAEGTPPVDADGFPRGLFAMIRAMLEERFKLAVREETRERAIYALVLARSDGRLGPKLRRSEVDCAAVMREEIQGRKPPDTSSGLRPCAVGGAPGRSMGSGLTIGMLAGVLPRLAGRPVVDKTGLAGVFDWDIDFAPDFQLPPLDRPDAIDRLPGDRPSIFTALQEQLGLRLESTRGQVDVLVINRVDRPTED